VTFRSSLVLRLGASLLAAALAGCSGERPADEDVQGAGTPEPNRPARTLPLPAAPGAEPPAAVPHAANGGGARALHWTLPAGWTEVPPASSMRVAQYRVAGPAGDGECVVYYFGPGQGGDPKANAVRWAQQFEQPDGRPSVDVMKLTRIEETRVPIDVVEVTGTYDGGMTMTDQPAERRPDYMLLGAIAQGPDAPWFFKFTGPEATVRGGRDDFLGLLRSIHVGR
jgi:hypothetical protein